MDLNSLSQYIKGQGWTDFGVLGIGSIQAALGKHEGVFERWLAQGYAADMDYLARMQADRFHPQNKLPSIKSAIVLMAWYGSDGDSSGEPALRDANGEITTGLTTGITTGKVAKYAQGRDYHRVLKKRLIDLSAHLKSQILGLETYASVDSGPTVDRVLAQAAGLGFFGKNANLIDPRRGSYFFIASLMLTAELSETPKKPMPNCGSCTRCIDVCATRAIIAPGVIDARRCIAYLTIENKGGIPLELRPAVGNRLFGCDICQEVCPFTLGRASQQQVRIEPLQAAKGAGPELDLRELLAMESDEAFMRRFAGTPLMRAKRRGILRNACVVAGNSGDASLIPHLRSLMEREEDPMLKEHAQWGIDKLKKVDPMPSA